MTEPMIVSQTNMRSRPSPAIALPSAAVLLCAIQYEVKIWMYTA